MAIIIVCVHDPGFLELAVIAYAQDLMGLGLRFSQSGQEHAGQYCNDRNHDQQFDKGERLRNLLMDRHVSLLPTFQWQIENLTRKIVKRFATILDPGQVFLTPPYRRHLLSTWVGDRRPYPKIPTRPLLASRLMGVVLRIDS